MGLSLLEIIIYAALAVIAVFAIVMLIISAVLPKDTVTPMSTRWRVIP